SCSRAWSVIAAVLNAQGRVLAVAVGIAGFNAALLAVLAWIIALGGAPPSAIGEMLAHGIVLAGIVQLMMTGIGFLHLRRGTMGPGQGAPVSGRDIPRRGGRAPRGSGLSAEARQFFVLAVPGLVAAGAPQLKLIAGAMVASSSRGGVSWLYYANRLYELPLGVVSITISAVLVPTIAAGVRSAKSR